LENEPPAPPPDAGKVRERLLETIDDSADMSVVSNAFASVVAAKIASDAVEPLPPDASVEDVVEASAGDEIDETNAVEEAPVEEAPSEPEPSLADIAPRADSAAFDSIADRDDDDALDVVLDGAAPPSAAPSVVPPPPTDPLLAAAARLRSIQRGDPLPAMAAPPKAASAPKREPPPAVVEPSAAAPAPTDPLLAAAARLKALRRN
jgi:hypothetical protein